MRDEAKERTQHVLEELDLLHGAQEVVDCVSVSLHCIIIQHAYRWRRQWQRNGGGLNILPDHRPEAEQFLFQAIKRNPSLVDAWNCLGECYWKCGNLQEAHHCFTGAIAHVSSTSCLPFHPSLSPLSLLLPPSPSFPFPLPLL